MIKRRNLQKAIKKSGLTVIKVSQILGYGDNAVAKWIYGKGEPSAAIMLKLTEILNVTADEVLKMFAESERRG